MRTFYRSPEDPSDLPKSSGGRDPSKDESRLESLLVKRDMQTKRFVCLYPDDHQFYFAFVAKRN